ncbi:nodulation protein NfeD [Exilibacterium tricleocarpae]|uniref:Nodulation protein NfeD n=1 Tax=Exilibacterium tricleocarpae TaxID=2591008 RepID=A0A545U5Q4_9GAMM|nr:nodulation protein NfeD [Exilibacterium tricleocarpae]TQV84804.1 nodulation protein NfeD [Exilibacterium tricleocarpae]
MHRQLEVQPLEVQPQFLRPRQTRPGRLWYVFAGLLLACGLNALANAQGTVSRAVWVLDVRGVIGPASADYVVRGIEGAARGGAHAVVLRLDTPGGLDKSMRTMVQAILSASVPVIGYVAPGGARAASAGTYILYASHVAAMAPATNLGAATPVQIGAPGLPGMPRDESPDGEEDSSRFEPATAMERKIVNDAAAYIEGLARLRNRNSDWAVKAVREGASLAAREALELQVIDLVATDLDALLTAVDGRTVTVNDRDYTLATEGAAVVPKEPDWRSEFLAVITDPNVAYVLMLVGIYGLIFEFSNPGMGVPGIVGAICLLLALYAFQVLPVSYAGVALIILGAGLMAAEAFAPSFGVLGLGGIVAFIIGSIILMDTELPGFQIALPIILAFATASAGLLILLLGIIARARRSAVVTGLATLVGEIARVEQVGGDAPMIRLQGELWQVACDQPLIVGDTVRVKVAEHIILQVEKTGGAS